MEHDQEIAAQERVQALADAAGLTIAPERLPTVVVAFDAARLAIAQVEELARRVDVPVSDAFDAAWRSGKGQR